MHLGIAAREWMLFTVREDVVNFREEAVRVLWYALAIARPLPANRAAAHIDY
jgi:hypothetical protein